MIDSIYKVIRSPKEKYDFTILIPSWNNKPYLELCLSSILKHSKLNIQIIIVVNEGKDDTLSYLDQLAHVDYLQSEQNLGICYGLNLARPMVKSDYIVYMNDDMYVLPEWDTKLMGAIRTLDTKMFMLSATMIEPHDTQNPCVVVKDYGDSLETFKEDELLRERENLKRTVWSGSTWPPNVMHVDMWDLVGGYSVEFSPGMYSDPDLSKKLYNAGVRIFRGVGDSLVYHFGSKSTKRVRKNTGRRQFLMKWGMSSRFFSQKILKLGQPYQELPAERILTNTERINMRMKLWRELWK